MLTREMDVAVMAVSRAGLLCEQIRAAQPAGDALAKDDRSPVTIADYGAQALIITALRQAFPDDPIVAEEDGHMLRGDDAGVRREDILRYVRRVDAAISGEAMLDAINGGGASGGPCGRFWTVDPIDGTKGFIRGDQYAVALALIEDGRPMLGVLGCPHLPAGALASGGARGLIFTARRGDGAECRPLRGGRATTVRVSDRRNPTEAVFCESCEKGHTAQGRTGRICALLGVAAAPVRLDSQCKYAIVARGEADVYMRLPMRVDYEEKIWDHAAGALIAEEAGGRVTDIAGTALDFTQGRTLRRNKGVLAAGRHLHGVVLEAIQNALLTEE